MFRDWYWGRLRLRVGLDPNVLGIGLVFNLGEYPRGAAGQFFMVYVKLEKL